MTLEFSQTMWRFNFLEDFQLDRPIPLNKILERNKNRVSRKIRYGSECVMDFGDVCDTKAKFRCIIFFFSADYKREGLRGESKP